MSSTTFSSSGGPGTNRRASDDAPTTGQKFAAELIGTFGLVFFGCGAAIGSGLAGDPSGYVVTGLAFGLAVVVMAYAFGRVSGGHFNPAITLGATLGGRLAWRQAGTYVAAQLVGGLLAGAVLFGLLHGFDGFTAEGNMWQNSFGDEGSGYAWWAALLLELLMTMLLVWVVLGVTDARNELQAVMGPLAIGFALAMAHFGSMFATRTSVNPARSIGVGVFAGTDAVLQLWLFIGAPILGGVIAGLTYPLLFGHGQEPVPGSGLSFGGGRRRAVPGGYEAQWNQGQAPAQWGQPQQWGPGASQQWGAPDPAYGAPHQQPAQQWGPPDPGYGAPQQSQPGQWGQPAAPHPGVQPGVQSPGAPGHWGNPDEDDDGRTQVRRPD
jgi:aquaporin Z